MIRVDEQSMAFAALSSVFSTGTLLAAPVTALSLIPLLALGINYYRYQSIDPEGRPTDAQKVNPPTLGEFHGSHFE